ncbi:GCN5 family acetyltransferase [Xenorhabdus sp. PB62.4]|nr:GCN5 family acetyltransferase [Xenorhabdus sp. PB62.4]
MIVELDTERLWLRAWKEEDLLKSAGDWVSHSGEKVMPVKRRVEFLILPLRKLG